MTDIERRGAQRVTLSPCGEADKGLGLSGMVHDLSETGMAFVADRPLAIGSSLMVGFSLADTEAAVTYPVEARVEVVRCEPREQGGHRIAVHFVDLDDEGTVHLREYLENLLILI